MTLQLLCEWPRVCIVGCERSSAQYGAARKARRAKLLELLRDSRAGRRQRVDSCSCWCVCGSRIRKLGDDWNNFSLST